MPRKPAILQRDFPYHVSARCINREWFKIPIEEVWSLSSDLLYFIEFAFGVRIHSFVLMSNHFHLIVSTPNSNISEAIGFFMRELTREINRRTGRINQAFGSRFYRTIIRTNHYFCHAYKYVYQNPVRAGIVRRVEDYPYSTIHGLLGFSAITVPVFEDTLLFENIESTLLWLNSIPNEEDSDIIRKALKRKEFKLPKDSKSKKDHRLEFDSL